MSDYTPIVGARPQYMSHDEWDTLLKTTPHCVRFLRGDCATPCHANPDDGTYNVDIDHIVPKSKGGTNEINQYQPLCSGYNRWEKRVDTDAHYSRKFWFDQAVDTSKLRVSQLERAYNVVVSQHPEFFSHPPAKAMASFFLLAWIVGAGKTVGILALLLGINNVINAEGPGRRRITKALVLVHQRTLVESLSNEIRKELVKYNIVSNEPRVITIKSGSDWGRVKAGDYDIAVACTQSIWEGDNRILSRNKLAEHLGVFEAVVVDECQFAPERFIELCDLAPRAWKFSMSATPMDRQGRFLGEDYPGRFVLLSSYSYDDGITEGVLKFVPEFNEGLRDGFYHKGEGGESEELIGLSKQSGSVNTKNRNNLVRDQSLLIRAADDVQNSDSDTTYDGHIMVKVESIAAAKTLVDRINSGHINMPDGPGWGATSVFSGSTGTKLSSDNHPWMVAKKRKKGKADPSRSLRIVVVVDIGQFGINNPFCTTIVWTCTNTSLVELVQRIGRAIRGHGTVRLYWNGKDDAMTKAMERAIDYIHNMDDRLAEGGFLDIDSFIEAQTQHVETPVAVTPHLSTVDRRMIDEMLGASILEEGEPLSQSAIDAAVNTWEGSAHNVTKQRLEAATDHAKKVSTDKVYRRKSFGLASAEISCKPITVREEPPADYSDDILIHALRAGQIPHADIDVAIHDMQSDEKWRAMFVMLKQNHDRKFFVKPSIAEGSSVHATLRSYASDFIRDFGLNREEHYGRMVSAVCIAAARYFDLPDTKKPTVEKHEAEYVDTLNKISTKKDIRGLARGVFLYRSPEVSASISTLYAGEIDAVAEFAGVKNED